MADNLLSHDAVTDCSSLSSADTSEGPGKSAEQTAVQFEYAPVVVFCYRRPDHLRRTLESLMHCDGFELTPVIVFGDGPKNPEQVEAVEQTREMARTLLGDRAEYHFREMNAGLARSVITGVGDVIGRFGRAIVIEDDLELAPGFLTYMNRALERFADNDRVWQVSGYMFDVPEFKSRSEAFFLPMTVSWGWATWKRAWDQFDLLAAGWERVDSDPSLRRRFNLEGAYDYATMLKRQMSGRLDSWAIRWYWTVFKANGLALFPPVTLVRNNGFDGSGSHGRGLFRSFTNVDKLLHANESKMPTRVEQDQEITTHVFDAIGRSNGGWRGKLIDWLCRLLRK
jgi:hypothetical protein